MAIDMSARDQIRTYLATLPINVRMQLHREIRRRPAQDGDAVVFDLIAGCLNDMMRDEGEDGRPGDGPPLLFTRPLEPFFVDFEGSRTHRGFIGRDAFRTIWLWLYREIRMRDAIAGIEASAATALIMGDVAKAESLYARLRAEAVGILEEAIRYAGSDPRKRMHMAMQLEGSRNLEVLPDIAAVFALEADLEAVTADLPDRIEDLGADRAATLIGRIAQFDGDPLYPLVAITSRLASPVQILCILTVFEGTDDGARLAGSRFSVCVDIVFAQLDMTAERIARTTGRQAELDGLVDAIADFHRLASGLAATIDLDGCSAWRAHLSALRRRASQSLTAELERIPGAVRRVMRSHFRDGGRDPEPVEEDIREAEYVLGLMVALKPYREEVAVNELLATVVGQIENHIEVVSDAILEDLRNSIGAERRTAERDMEIALRLNTIVFGADYAALLRKSADNATQLPFGTADALPAGKSVTMS